MTGGIIALETARSLFPWRLVTAEAVITRRAVFTALGRLGEQLARALLCRRNGRCRRWCVAFHMTRHMRFVFDLAIRLAVQRFAAGRAAVTLIAALAFRTARFMQIATAIGRMQAARCRGIALARRVGLALAVVAVERFALAITRLETARLAITRRIRLALAVVTVERFALAITRLETAPLAVAWRIGLAFAVVTVERFALAITRIETARLAVAWRIRLAFAVVTVERFAFTVTRIKAALFSLAWRLACCRTARGIRIARAIG